MSFFKKLLICFMGTFSDIKSGHSLSLQLVPKIAVHYCNGGELLVTCADLIDSKMESGFLLQKALTITAPPTGWFPIFYNRLVFCYLWKEQLLDVPIFDLPFVVTVIKLSNKLYLKNRYYISTYTFI